MRFKASINEAKQGDPLMDYVMTMLHARTQAHMLHWTVTGPGSFAKHMALNNFYDKVPSLLDGFVESFQGKYGLLHDFKPGFEVPFDPLSFITSIAEFIESVRRKDGFPQDSYLQNQVDEMLALTYSTRNSLKHYE
jgi:Family of unknown function (DUF5856)